MKNEVKKSPLLFCVSFIQLSITAQNRIAVKGIVVDEKNNHCFFCI